MVRSRKEAIKFVKEKAVVVEALCSGCGICIKKCPFKAISIVRLPDELEKECSHRFGQNTFKLFRLPTPSPGTVLGLLGKNGIGKSTTLRILSGEITLNLGNYESPPNLEQVIQHFRGSTLQDFFRKRSRDQLRVSHKPQYVDKIPAAISGNVGGLLEKIDERGTLSSLSEDLDLKNIWDRPLRVLSGGELQRVAVTAAICREADTYLFDEPSSYLDVEQRLNVARAIRSLKEEKKTIVVAEHDLAIIDYLSDQICIFYGEPGVYGIITHAHAVRTGINIYLQGYIPEENVRFREQAVVFHEKAPTLGLNVGEVEFKWDQLEKTYKDFKLTIFPGQIKKGEIIGILGPNGIGKTTFVRILAGVEKPDNEEQLTKLEVSYKPQYISGEYKGTVQELLTDIAGKEYSSSWYRTEVLQPLKMDLILDRELGELSGGELQKTAIASCLSHKARLYLLDEPSAYLDVEERLNMARAVRRVIENHGALAFVVEHDIVAQDFVADRLMVFTGRPGSEGIAETPTSLREGMNAFLRQMAVTFRRDPTTKRPRVNKENSRLDRLQKETGEYYYVIPVKGR